MGFGGDGSASAARPIEPMPPIVCIDRTMRVPVVAAAAAAGARIDPNAGFDGLPETEVLNRLTGEWRRLPHLTTGETYELKDPDELRRPVDRYDPGAVRQRATRTR